MTKSLLLYDDDDDNASRNKSNWQMQIMPALRENIPHCTIMLNTGKKKMHEATG
jgi:hypothetical protein